MDSSELLRTLIVLYNQRTNAYRILYTLYGTTYVASTHEKPIGFKVYAGVKDYVKNMDGTSFVPIEIQKNTYAETALLGQAVMAVHNNTVLVLDDISRLVKQTPPIIEGE